MIKTKVNKLDKIEGNQNQMLRKKNEDLKERVKKLEILMQTMEKKRKKEKYCYQGSRNKK